MNGNHHNIIIFTVSMTSSWMSDTVTVKEHQTVINIVGYNRRLANSCNLSGCRALTRIQWIIIQQHGYTRMVKVTKAIKG